MLTFIVITLVAALISGAYLYFEKKATIQIGTFPGVLVGSSYTNHEIEYEDADGNEKTSEMGTLQFSLVFIMITIVWIKK